MEALLLIGYAIIGILAGFISGLIGISGGVITVPLLFLLFHFQGLPQAYLIQLAIGTSLASMVSNACSATIWHQRHRAIDWTTIKIMTPGIVVGSISGGIVARLISAIFLEMLFGLFACALAIYYWKRKKRHRKTHKHDRSLIATLSGGIAFFAALLGIGGGIFTVPLLSALSFSEEKAIGTSAAAGLFITTFGALSFLFLGVGQIELPEVLGYIYLPAFFLVGITSFFAAPFGANLTYQLPEKKLQKIFAIFLFAAGILMLF